MVSVGWANVERYCLANLLDKAGGDKAAAQGLAPVLQLLAALYALTRYSTCNPRLARPARPPRLTHSSSPPKLYHF